MRIVLIALFGAMVVVAVRALVAAPPTGRLFVRVGNPPGLDGTVGKRTGLVMWLVLGTIILVGSLLAERDNEGIVVLGVAGLAFLLLLEIVSVRRLTR